MSSRIENIYIPREDSPCQAWRNYFESLQKEYGRENAREAWLYTWSQKGNTSCTKSKAFNQWAEKNKIAVADGVDKALAGFSGIGQNLIGGIEKLTGLTPKLAAALLIGGVGISLFLAYRIAKELKPTDIRTALPLGKIRKVSQIIKQK